MAGYLDAPEKTAEVIRDGWYVTGDIARIDEDGFIFITDRLSRFSKIGGEMVPHVKVEDAINAILGDSASVVTAVPDASKGERLIAFYARQDVTPETLWERLCQTDLPKLWIPKRESVLPIEAIPTLGTGKVDLRRVKQLALERAADVRKSSKSIRLRTSFGGQVTRGNSATIRRPSWSCSSLLSIVLVRRRRPPSARAGGPSGGRRRRAPARADGSRGRLNGSRRFERQVAALEELVLARPGAASPARPVAEPAPADEARLPHAVDNAPARRRRHGTVCRVAEPRRSKTPATHPISMPSLPADVEETPKPRLSSAGCAAGSRRAGSGLSAGPGAGRRGVRRKAGKSSSARAGSTRSASSSSSWGLRCLLGYSMANVGPLGRVAMGFALSLGMLGTGVVLERRETYRNYAYGLMGGGWAGVYFTTYAMHALPAALVVESELVALAESRARRRPA